MLNLVGLSPLKSMQCFQDSSVKQAHLCLPVKSNISSGRVGMDRSLNIKDHYILKLFNL